MPSQSLSDIRKSLTDSKTLVIDENTVGVDCVTSLKKLFPKNDSFTLTDCELKSEGADYLTISGHVAHLLPSPGNIPDPSDISLILLDRLNERNKRHLVFAISAPSSLDLYPLLTQYGAKTDPKYVDGSEAAEEDLDLLFENIELAPDAGQQRLVFSSIDTTNIKSDLVEPVRSLAESLPSQTIQKGINFAVHVTPAADWTEYITEILEVTGKAETCSQGSIYLRKQEQDKSERPYVRFRNQINAKLEVKADPADNTPIFALRANAVTFELPLMPSSADDDEDGAEVILDGEVIFGKNGNKFGVSADIGARYGAVRLAIKDFPSLSKLVELAGGNELSAYFPEPLSGLFNIQLSELSLTVEADDRPSVSQIACRIETGELKLFPGLSIKPKGTLRVDFPFDAENRSLEGELSADWDIKLSEGPNQNTIPLQTTISFPSYRFYAGLAEGRSISLADIGKNIDATTQLPNLKITKMEFSGDLLAKSLWAEMEVATGEAWGFDLNKHSYRVEGIRIGFGIDKLDDSDDDMEGVKIGDGKQWALSCEMEGHFKLCDATLFVSAQYDGGWTLLGGTEGETGLKVGLLIQDLFPQLQVPKTLNYLELTNLTLSAALKEEEYSISGQIKKWRPVEDCKFEVAVDEFSASYEGKTLSGMLIVVVSIDDVSVRLSAEKKGGQDGGWKFKGSTGAGQKIPIDKVILWMAEQFGSELSRPEAIESCSISELAIEFDTETKDFSFKCDGAVQLKNTHSPLKGSIHIDIAHVKETATYNFGGELEIDGLKFKLSFESEKKRSLLIGSYDTEQKAIALDSLIGELLSTEVQTGLTLNVNRALLAYTSDEEGWAILCQINLGLGIDLGAQLSGTKIDFLRTAGLSLPPGQHFGFDDLQIRYASQSFSANRVQAVSNLLKGDSLALPASSRGAAPSSSNADAGKSTGNGGKGGAEVIPIEKGFSFSAKLNLGSSEQALVLPAGGNEKDSEGKQESKELTTAAKWFNIQKSFGPLHVGRLGFEYIPAEKTEAAAAQNDRRPGLAFLLDSSVELFGLRLGLIGFRIEAPLKAIMERDAAKLLNQITLDISGLELGLKQGPVEISGGLLKYGDPPKFVGNILIKTDAFAIFGFGAYETLNGQPSLFLFAALDMDLGGPPCFHVTGLAAGFGYNRRLTLPPIEKVETFPLVRAALEPSEFTDLAVCRGQIDSVSTAAVGDYWLAAGVKFTSFEMIESFVLLAVGFGTETVISILGLSKIKVPSKAPADVPVIAYAELALKVSLRPESGVLSAEALLTSNSYIFTKDCKITGGFAFYAWFKDLTLNEHGKEIQKIKAGDFVVTLGGYHPKFKPPAHYPVVPRLGLTWKVSDSLQISGELYFALTPNCLMLGGRLSALFQEGGLKAWFVVYADFLVAWNPLYYEATVGLRIGVAYLGTALGISINLSIELSAEVHLWGPPLSGRAEIHWSFLSFTICFGSQDKKPAEALKLEDFAKSCLPPGHETLTVTAVQGLVKQKRDGEIIVNPYQLKLLVKSAVPSTKITVNGTPISIPKEISTPKEFSIRPVQEPAESELEITIRQSTQKQAMQDQPVLQNVSSALWGEGPLKPPDIQKVNGSELLINDVLTGVELSPLQPKASEEYKEFVDSLKDLPFSLTWQYRYAEAGKAYEPSEVIDVVQHPNHGTVTYRSEILGELKNSGWVEATPAEAVLEEAFRGIELQSPPVKCRLGSLPAFPIAWPYIDRERDLTTGPVESDVSSEEVDMVRA